MEAATPQDLVEPALLPPELCRCGNCGYRLGGMPELGQCAECGAPFDRREVVMVGWPAGPQRWWLEAPAVFAMLFIAIAAYVLDVSMRGLALVAIGATLAVSG